jgi:hypothetical protein
VDQTFVKQQLIEWIKAFVETPNSLLGHWAPCPYARAARLNNKIEIKFSQARDLLFDVVNNIDLLKNKDVIIFCFDHNEILPESLTVMVAGMNQALMKVNVVALEDHPGIKESISGVDMNFGPCGLLLVQNLDKLNTASHQLKEKGYYKTWSMDNLDDVVNWRNDEIRQN